MPTGSGGVWLTHPVVAVRAPECAKPSRPSAAYHRVSWSPLALWKLKLTAAPPPAAFASDGMRPTLAARSPGAAAAKSVTSGNCRMLTLLRTTDAGNAPSSWRDWMSIGPEFVTKKRYVAVGARTPVAARSSTPNRSKPRRSARGRGREGGDGDRRGERGAEAARHVARGLDARGSHVSRLRLRSWRAGHP